MDQIHPYRALALALNPLAREGNRRGDAEFITPLLNAPGSRFLLVWRTGVMVLGLNEGQPTPLMIGPRTAAPYLESHAWAFLGLLEGEAVFALDLSPLDTAPDFGPDALFADLRRAGPLMQREQAAMLGHAKSLLHWREHTKFCSKCGAKLIVQKAGHVMHCDACATDHFPRTDAAVIMLVTDGERALLAQPRNLRRFSVFTTLAGFVEPGESLEEAVAREVFEETGVKVADVCYQASQPWPFPASIMLGFTAKAISTAITIDPEEIIEARWFTRDEARAQNGFHLPPNFSIAWRLINAWLDEE